MNISNCQSETAVWEGLLRNSLTTGFFEGRAFERAFLLSWMHLVSLFLTGGCFAAKIHEWGLGIGMFDILQGLEF